jgi:hypothetical protein
MNKSVVWGKQAFEVGHFGRFSQGGAGSGGARGVLAPELWDQNELHFGGAFWAPYIIPNFTVIIFLVNFNIF